MTDRELLEMAAKAARVFVFSYFDSELYGTGINTGEVDAPLWNPLANDGQALQLAVKLDLLYQNEDFVWAFGAETSKGGCQYAATRRAIVVAAAEIGKYAK